MKRNTILTTIPKNIRILIISIMCSVCMSVQAQYEYQPFVKEGKTWNMWGSYDRKYLIINEPYYMWIEYWPKVNEQIMSYEAEGHCGELHEQPNGYLKMQDRIYKVEYGNGTDCTSLKINITNKNHYFHLVPMPKYLRRIFGPALAYNNQ